MNTWWKYVTYSTYFDILEPLHLFLIRLAIINEKECRTSPEWKKNGIGTTLTSALRQSKMMLSKPNGTSVLWLVIPTHEYCLVPGRAGRAVQTKRCRQRFLRNFEFRESLPNGQFSDTNKLTIRPENRIMTSLNNCGAGAWIASDQC